MTIRKSTPRRARRVTLGLTALATTLALAACGSGSTTTGTGRSTTAAASASANRTGFTKCLQQHGITIPQHTPGSGTSPAHSGPPLAGGGGAGKASATRQAAFKACGANGQHARTG